MVTVCYTNSVNYYGNLYYLKSFIQVFQYFILNSYLVKLVQHY